MSPGLYNADPDPDPAQNLDADPGGRGGRSDKNVHPPRQNPRYAPAPLIILLNGRIVDQVVATLATTPYAHDNLFVGTVLHLSPVVQLL